MRQCGTIWHLSIGYANDIRSSHQRRWAHCKQWRKVLILKSIEDSLIVLVQIISESMDGISWEEFSKNVDAIFERSKEIGDTWDVVRTVIHFKLNVLCSFPQTSIWTGNLQLLDRMTIFAACTCVKLHSLNYICKKMRNPRILNSQRSRIYQMIYRRLLVKPPAILPNRRSCFRLNIMFCIIWAMAFHTFASMPPNQVSSESRLQT